MQKREVCVEPLHPKSAQVDAITPSFFLLVKESRSLFLSISPVGQVHLVLGFPWISDLLHLILQAALRGDGQAAAAALPSEAYHLFAFLAWLTLLALSLSPLIT